MTEQGQSVDMVMVLRRQLDATLAMLERAIAECPDSAWTTDEKCLAVWQQAYHTLLSLAIWLHWPTPTIAFPAFHRQGVDDTIGAAPAYSREVIEEYRKEVYAVVADYFARLTPENLMEVLVLRGQSHTRADIVMGQIRHAQHHVGCIHAQLRRRTGTSPKWI